MLRRIAAGTVALPFVGASAASVCAPVRHAALNIDQLIKSVTDEGASPKAKAKASAKAPATEFDDDSLSEVFAGLSGNPAASAPPVKPARGKGRAAKVVDDDAWLTEMLSSAPAESAAPKVTRGRAKRTPQTTSSDASVEDIMESLGISPVTAKAPARRSRAAKSDDNAAALDDIIAAVKKGTRTRRSTKPAPKAKAAKTRAPAKRRAQAAKQAPTRGRRAPAKAASKAPQKKATSVVVDDLVSSVISQAAQAPKKTAAAGGKINVDELIATTLTSGKTTSDGPQIVEKDVTGTLLLQTGGFSAINLDELPSDKYATTFGSFVVAMQLPNIPPTTRVKCDLIVNPVHKHFSNTSQLMAINVRKL